jgi:hypothetical protein
LQGFANTSVHCISVSVLRGFASVAFGDPKISINYKWSGALPIGFVVATLIPNNSLYL